MNVISFKNYGVKNIEHLIQEFDGKESTVENVRKLKTEIENSFYNNPFIDFSTKGNVSFMLVDYDNGGNCEIIYN